MNQTYSSNPVGNEEIAPAESADEADNDGALGRAWADAEARAASPYYVPYSEQGGVDVLGSARAEALIRDTAPLRLDVARVTGRKERDVPTSYRGRADGYGSRIPTHFVLQLDGKRWYRIYCVCWGTSGTLYVRIDGQPHYFTYQDAFPVQHMGDRS